jgi:hypothetical protein
MRAPLPACHEGVPAALGSGHEVFPWGVSIDYCSTDYPVFTTTISFDIGYHEWATKMMIRSVWSWEHERVRK